MGNEQLFLIYILLEAATWFIVSNICIARAHVIRHELGHIMEYEKYVDVKAYPAIIHVKPHTRISPFYRMQAKVMGVQIKEDIDEWMEIKEGEKNRVRGMAEMPGKLTNPDVVKRLALGGIKNDLRGIFWYNVCTAFLLMLERAVFVYCLHMPVAMPDMGNVLLVLGAILWLLAEAIAFLLSGKNEGDLYFYIHPEKWN